MNIGQVGQLPAAVSQANTGDAVAIAVLKKTLDTQAQAALQLVQALPPVPPAVPSGSVDTFA